MIDTHTMKAEEAAAEVRRIATVEELDQVVAREEAHPRYDGGRSTVLEAARERREDLLASVDPEPGPGFRTTSWKGHDNYECELCPFATLDRAAIEEHVANRCRPVKPEPAPSGASDTTPETES